MTRIKNIEGIAVFVIGILVFGCNNHKGDNEAEIKRAMYNQQIAWNNGDIDAFMTYYWKSDSLLFIGKRGITYGWQHTLNNYKKSYPDKTAMGQLQFTNLNLFSEGDSYTVIGKWELYRISDTLSGYYTLLWRKLNNQWVIVQDHSS
jgi:ketosteroid isomerase-like protein